MEKVGFLPLGSIITIKGSEKKLMIVSRGLKVVKDNKTRIMDYGTVTYPEGMIGDQIIFLNHSEIDSVIFEGYCDKENDKFLEMTNNIYDTIKE